MSDSLGVRVFGEGVRTAEKVVRAAGLRVVRGEPDVVLCHGGDGTLLRAERAVPGVPKVPARVGRKSKLCKQHELPAILGRLVAGRLDEERLGLIELECGRRRYQAVNDVVLRNRKVTTAVRFRLFIDGQPNGHEVTGDGVVFATPYGSTAYYRSITRGAVRSGIGVAFNNSTEEVEHFVAGAHERIEVEVTRGPAELVYDNSDRTMVLKDGARFAVSLSEKAATVWGLDALRCRTCRRLGGERFNPH